MRKRASAHARPMLGNLFSGNLFGLAPSPGPSSDQRRPPPDSARLGGRAEPLPPAGQQDAAGTPPGELRPNGSWLTQCAHCSRAMQDALICSRCKRAAYCSEACRVAAWRAGHGIECSAAGAEPPAALRVAKKWSCEYACGFHGTFEEVSAHERVCELGKASSGSVTPRAGPAGPVPPPRRRSSLVRSGSMPSTPQSHVSEPPTPAASSRDVIQLDMPSGAVFPQPRRPTGGKFVSEPPTGVKFARAEVAHQKQSDTELDLKEGDVVKVLQEDGSGWCLGELNGLTGW